MTAFAGAVIAPFVVFVGPVRRLYWLLAGRQLPGPFGFLTPQPTFSSTLSDLIPRLRFANCYRSPSATGSLCEPPRSLPVALERGTPSELVEDHPDPEVTVGTVRGTGLHPVGERPLVGEKRLKLGVDVGVRTARRDTPDHGAEPLRERPRGSDERRIPDLARAWHGGWGPRRGSGRLRRDLPEPDDAIGDQDETPEPLGGSPSAEVDHPRRERGDELVIPPRVVALRPDPDHRGLLAPDQA